MKSMYLVMIMLCGLLVSTAQAKELKLGEALTLQDVTKVSEINKNPDEFVGKRVLVEGLIINVCTTRGCWMDIASDLPFEKIQIKVVDGEIVFPMEAKGRTAQVEGVVEGLEMTEEQAISFMKHQAHEAGTTFDPASVTGPMSYYRIRGLGAVIN